MEIADSECSSTFNVCGSQVFKVVETFSVVDVEIRDGVASRNHTHV